MIRLQTEPLDPLQLLALLDSPQGETGATVTFCGTVRDDGAVLALELEQYPGMTGKALLQLEEEARLRWTLAKTVLVHRTGRIALGQPIVWIGISSPHRAEAFAACEFLIDALKSRVPLWKKVHYRDGHSQWLEAHPADQQRAGRWQEALSAPPSAPAPADPGAPASAGTAGADPAPAAPRE